MIAITALRVLVGWHFLYEGLTRADGPIVDGGGLSQTGQGTARRVVQVARHAARSARQCGPDHDVGALDRRRLPRPGLFTRLASLAGIGFILLFYLSPPRR